MRFPPYDGTPLTSSNKLVLAPEFTFSTWIWSTGLETKPFQYIFNKSAWNSNFIFQISFQNNYLYIFYKVKADPASESQQRVQCVVPLSSSYWYNLGVAIHFDVTSTQPIFYVNGTPTLGLFGASTYSMGQPNSGPFQDDNNSNYAVTIGALQTGETTFIDSSKRLTGYIYSIKIWNIAVDPTIDEVQNNCNGWCYHSGGITCDVCPINYDGSSANGLCLYQSPIEDSEWTSTSCHSNCVDKGCRISTDSSCSLCRSNLCDVCNDYANTETACQSCIDGAVKDSSNFCNCSYPKTYSYELKKCVFDYPLNCKSCSFSANGYCSACSSNNCINPESGAANPYDLNLLCLPTCPLGYSISSKICSATNANQLIVHYIFDQQIEILADLVSGYKAYIGINSDSILYPIPVYQSGLFFNGNVYASMPPNSADPNNLILGNTYNVFIWARPKSTLGSSNTYLLCKENDSNMTVALGFAPSLIPVSTHLLYDKAASLNTSTFSGSSPIANSWIYYQFIAERSNINDLTISLSYNLIPLSAKTYPSVFLQEFASDLFIIGKSSKQNIYFIGFIYEIEIYNFKATSLLPALLPTGCGCNTCANLPNSGSDCLYSCNYNEFWNSGSFTSCDTQNCLFECMRDKDCIKNENVLCLEYTGFKNTECQTCISSAIMTSSGCLCPGISNYDQSTNSCTYPKNSVFDSVAGTCLCTSTWVIDPTEKACVCPKNSVFNSLENKCVCASNSNFDQTTSSCKCISNSAYNSTINSYTCATNSIFDQETNSCKCMPLSSYNAMNNSCDCISNSNFNLEASSCACIENSNFDQITNSCKCIDHSSYISASNACICDSLYQLIDGLCVKMHWTYYLQSSDIVAYFCSDYSSVIFDMKFPVVSNTPAACSQLFQANSLSKFGNSLLCGWADDMKSLSVILGDNATLLEEDVKFIPGSLYTTKVAIDNNPSENVVVKIKFKYAKPQFAPQAMLDAPSKVYYSCDDLVPNASQFTEGYKRPLSYSWTFSSDPEIASLSSSVMYPHNASVIHIPKQNLCVASVTVKLKIENWLGGSSTSSKNITIFDWRDLTIALDTHALLQPKTDQNNSISISTESKCSGPHSYSYA